MPYTVHINNSPVICHTQGNADSEHIILTIGPGSLYFPIYANSLKSNFHFIAFDFHWIHMKDAPADPKAIDTLTLESLVVEIQNAVNQLKNNFPNKKIHLLANSIVTGLALACANAISSLDSTICIGTPLKPITPDFSHVKDLPLSPAEKEQLEYDIQRYDALMKGERLDEKLPSSNVKSGAVTPVSSFVEQCRSLNVLALYDRLRHEDTIMKMWQHSPTGENFVLNLAMRDHFFEKIQAQLDIPILLGLLNGKKAKVLLTWGERDGITPYDVTLLQQWPNLEQRIFSESGHFPQLEAADFNDIIFSFIGLNKPKHQARV